MESNQPTPTLVKEVEQCNINVSQLNNLINQLAQKIQTVEEFSNEEGDILANTDEDESLEKLPLTNRFTKVNSDMVNELEKLDILTQKLSTLV